MTRRKRSLSHDRSNKRVGFNIPASLQQLSALSRSLAIQNGVSLEKDNANIVARAQALSQSPTADTPWQQDGKAQQPRDIRFKHDSRQFPNRQEWPQPTPNQGAVGHARFLEKQWQSAENMRRAQVMQQQIEEDRQRMQDQAMSNTAALHNYDPRGNGISALAPMSTNTPKQNSVDIVSRHQPEFSDSQQWPNAAPRTSQRQYDLDIEQRRQAIIARLMERQPASIATSSSNIQIPTTTSPQSTAQMPEPAEVDTPLDFTTQQNQIAVLIERKRAENAANGSLNRWLAARADHQRLQEEAQMAKPSSPSPSSQAAAQSKPYNPFVFKPHPSNLASQMPAITNINSAGKIDRGSAQEDVHTQEMNLGSLFSSPAPSPQQSPSRRQIPDDEADDNVSKEAPTQLPSPSLSSPSQQEAQRVPSPSAQLLMNLANAAPSANAQAPPHSTFRTPSLSVSTQGLTRTSSAARQRQSISRTPLDGPLTPQQQEMRLMQRQTEQQRQEHNLKHFQQQMQAKAASVQYPQVRPQQTMQRPASSTSTSSNSNTAGYYKIKPHLWDAFSTDKFAMHPPSYVQTNTSNTPNANVRGSSANYNMSGMNALDNSNMYSGPRGAGYSSFANGGGANANFRMSTQNNFGVPKR